MRLKCPFHSGYIRKENEGKLEKKLNGIDLDIEEPGIDVKTPALEFFIG